MKPLKSILGQNWLNVCGRRFNNEAKIDFLLTQVTQVPGTIQFLEGAWHLFSTYSKFFKWKSQTL
jgi:hypothetical protein